MQSMLEIITSDALATPHGFFTRKGGASSGIFAGLNCGTGSTDQAEIVAINRARVAEAMGVDADRLAVMGDSAGGNLAALVALAARDQGLRAPALQVLIYPGCDFTMGQPSIDTFAEGFMLTSESIRWFRNLYLPDSGAWRDPAVSPLFADPTGVAPALVFTAGFDPLRDEGRAYAALMAQAGVPVVDRCFDDLIHGFYNIGITRATLMAADEVNRTIAAALAGSHPSLQS